MTIVMAPLRALLSPFTGGTPDFRRAPALAGYRYLVRYPDGEEQRAVIDWLYAYERDQERWGRALRLADWIPEYGPEERAELVEKTTEERLALVDDIDQYGTRSTVLRGVAREFPDSEGGKAAGLRARAEREDAASFIRITVNFCSRTRRSPATTVSGSARCSSARISATASCYDSCSAAGACSRSGSSPTAKTRTSPMPPASSSCPRRACAG